MDRIKRKCARLVGLWQAVASGSATTAVHVTPREQPRRRIKLDKASSPRAISRIEGVGGESGGISIVSTRTYPVPRHSMSYHRPSSRGFLENVRNLRDRSIAICGT